MAARADIFVDAMKRRHGFDTWQGRSRFEANLFVSNMEVAGDELPEWQAVRIQPVRAPNWPPTVQAIWYAPADGRAVHVTSFECPSRDAAHEFLVRTLANVQSPLIGRRDDVPIGDVVFADPSGTTFVYARANLVVLVRRAGGLPGPVVGPAAAFDARLVTPPTAPAEGELAVEVATPEDADERTFALGMETPAADEPTALGEAPPPMYKFYSPSGDLYQEGGEVRYRAQSKGDQVVRLYELRRDAPPATAVVQFSAP